MDTNKKVVSNIDMFESFIWTDRYCGYGDFELYSPVTDELLSVLKQDYYILFKSSDRTMIIEDIQINSDLEDGAKLIVSGRSLESILDRRIVWAQTVLKGNFQDAILQLLNENVINPTNPSRKISSFIFKPSTNPLITALTIEIQLTGETLYDAITAMCYSKDIGYRITMNEQNQFVFELLIGEDRTYDQLINPYVVFSPKYENLLNSNYIQTCKSQKTVTLVAGEGEGKDRKTLSVPCSSGELTELNRKEMFTDARDISSNVSETPLTAEEYNKLLKQRGEKELSENIFISNFEGEADFSTTFEYGKDYFIGDIIQIENEYGFLSKSKITEIVYSNSVSGNNIVPTFSSILPDQIEFKGGI